MISHGKQIQVYNILYKYLLERYGKKSQNIVNYFVPVNKVVFKILLTSFTI